MSAPATNTPYFYNAATGLWYEATAISTGNGITIELSDTGVANPPPYQPVAGTPLISLAEYLAIMGVTSVPNEAQWYHAALAVSDGIERSCWVSFREDGITVPDGLKVVVARAIAAMLGQLKPSVTPGLQSETFSSYSYTLADTAAASDSLAAFSGDIKRYRRPFLGA